MEIHHYKPPIVVFLESRTAKNLKIVIDPLNRVLHAFWLKGGGADAPPWLRQGGHFEVNEGHPDFLQITRFFLNAVLLLYLKLFTCLEIITMLK